MNTKIVKEVFLTCISKLSMLTLSLSIVFPLVISAQSSARDLDKECSTQIGKLLPAEEKTNMVRIPPKHQKTVENNIQKLVNILLNNSALQPPMGFNFKTGTNAYAPPLPVSLHAPLASTVTGLFYWYTYMPAFKKIQPLSVAMQAMYIRVNDISTVFNKLERWELDGSGNTYVEPQQIRLIGGYPQYSTGVVVVKNNPNPIWIPISRESALQLELEQRQRNLDSLTLAFNNTDNNDAEESLEKWLAEREEREKEMEKSYRERKKTNPEYAEKLRKNFFEVERTVEATLRETAKSMKTVYSRNNEQYKAEIGIEEECIKYLQDKLARLTSSERSAPAYISLKSSTEGPSSSNQNCSCIVEPGSPDSRRLVTENPNFYVKKITPDAIQVILIDFSNFEGSVPATAKWRSSWKYAVYERIRDNLDYSALKAMLHQQ